MKRKRLRGIIILYTSMIVVAITCLVFWVIYVINAYQTIHDMAIRLGVTPGGYFHWIVLAIGCGMLGLLIAGLSWQMASNISDFQYSKKQQEFVSNITHELKSPLAAIKLHCQTLMQPDLSLDERKSFLQHILQQSNRMTHLVEDVLEISRLQGRQAPLRLEVIDLSKVVTEHMEELKIRVKPGDICLVSEIHSELKIFGNHLAVHRILDNLLDNAMKASLKGGEVGCRLGKEGRYAKIQIWDDGIGISKKELPHIFKRFYQIGSEIRGRRKGTGLGLAIVLGLVKEMKGQISVSSRGMGEGSKFEVLLPLEEV